MEAKYFVCPVVWKHEGELSVAVFLDRGQGETVTRAAPDPPQGGWQLFPMNELELLAWLREQRAQGVAQLLLNASLNSEDPSKLAGHVVNLPALLDSGKTLELFRHLAGLHEKGGESGPTQ